MDLKFLEEAQTLANKRFQGSYTDNAIVTLDVTDGNFYFVFLLIGGNDFFGLRAPVPKNLEEINQVVDHAANQIDRAVMQLPTGMKVKRYYSPEYNEAALRRNPVTLARLKGVDGEVVFDEIFPHKFIANLQAFDLLMENTPTPA